MVGVMQNHALRQWCGNPNHVRINTTKQIRIVYYCTVSHPNGIFVHTNLILWRKSFILIKLTAICLDRIILIRQFSWIDLSWMIRLFFKIIFSRSWVNENESGNRFWQRRIYLLCHGKINVNVADQLVFILYKFIYYEI